ncbi:MAG: hypothetical protein IJT42_01015 [Treponema sp.]|nr:hypothetical protein [Treponema sp.]
MKKMKWIEKLAGIIAAGALISFTMTGLLGCNQTLDDEDERSTTGGSTPGASSGGTGVKVENLTAAKTLSATANAGYTVKLGCDGSAMKVTSVKYNGSELMPANTAYTLENLSFSGVNVSGLSADTWSVEYAYTMTKVGTDAWSDYNFEIADGNTENGALGYWSLRYDNYAVGYLNGYHEYGEWGKDHVGGVASSDAAYGGHWYGMENKIENFDHSQSLNKTLVMKIEKTDSAFVITIKSNGTEIWKCTNDKAESSGNSGETGTGGESETNIPVAAYTAKLDGTDTGVTIVGNGSYVDDEKFGKVFKNDGTAQRTSYLQLPADTLQHSATSKEMTIGFWVNNTTDDTGMFHPIFSAYAQKNAPNTWPMFILQSRGLAQVNCAGWCDFAAAQNDTGTNTESIAWLGEKGTWHYYTCVMTETTLKVYADGTLINAWTIDGTSNGQVLSGMFTSAELVYVCLGGNQAWDWTDNDAPYSFAKFSIWNTALSQEQIQAVVAAS